MRKYSLWIWIISIAVPGLVALLYFGPKLAPETDLSFLPRIYAFINFLTAIVLVMALRAIRQKKIMKHRNLMIAALVMSALFLILYVIYHSTAESTKYGGEGLLKYIYYVILISHILLSAMIVPTVLVTLVRALKGDFERHKKLAKWTWPIWFYVAISGVIVYLMISPFY